MLAGVLLTLSAATLAAEQRLSIAPRLTDDRLPEADPPHIVIYDPVRVDAPLLVWLGGTGGKPDTGPRHFYETALQTGYRVLALSYVNTPAVSQVCMGATLRAQPGCAGLMRQQRAWGDVQTGLVADRPEDAIVSRLTRLLHYLAQADASGQWSQYIDGDGPRWARLTLAGQSQGGGMAAFIAQTRQVAGVIMFSGGWDHRAAGALADWYSRPSQTPATRWHGTYHANEVQAAALARVYQRLGLPAAQIHALSLPVEGRLAHGEGITNPAYKALWLDMLQPGR
ncbi:MAG: hypothetical protein C0505_15780 [Leptothrix sp. (in: Bacteria)]|nr:hypothetical protein [Leptothrix sp. (in: b-proteobacteria)]